MTQLGLFGEDKDTVVKNDPAKEALRLQISLEGYQRKQTEMSKAFDAEGKPISGPEVIQTVRAESDTCLLAFSCGKDSIAAWLAIQDHFPNIIPFYMYLIPGLEFVEQSLTYYEQVFGTHIIRVPHPSLYRMMNALVYQPPERIRVIEAAGLPDFDYDQVTDFIKREQGLSLKTTYTAHGVRAADSPTRRSAVTQYGPINYKRRTFWPVWDMVKAELIDLIASSGIKLPIDYQLFGRSFDGLDYRFLKPIQEAFPADYAKILEWFPLAHLDIMRYGMEY